jgi:hypothetical protein
MNPRVVLGVAAIAAFVALFIASSHWHLVLRPLKNHFVATKTSLYDAIKQGAFSKKQVIQRSLLTNSRTI